jgi:RND family efflux transporter MFP subunit
VNVKEGDVVKEGDIVAEIESADQKSAVTSAGARVAAAKARAEASRANLEEIKQQMEREKTLVERGVTGRAALDDLTARSKSLERAVGASDADVRAAQTEVESLRVSLSSTAIRAPMNGTVISKPAEVGEIVGALELAPLFELADLDSMMVETDVPEGRLHLIRIGAPAEIVLDAYPSKRFRGAAAEIGKRVNRSKGTVMVKVKFVDAMEGVLPEMSARVSFLAEALSAEAMKAPPKRVIPAAAVVERAGAKMVFVVDEGKIRMTPVTLGAAVGSGLELVDGPPPGTRLVSNPPPEMTDGQKIKEKAGNGE